MSRNALRRLRTACLALVVVATIAMPAMAQTKAQRAAAKAKEQAIKDAQPSYVAGYILTAAGIGIAIALISAKPRRKDASDIDSGDLW